MKMATWNTRSLTFERFKYCEGLGYDVLAITELWRKQSKYQSTSTKYTTSAPKIIQKGPRKGQMRFPKDKAAGVGILLSARAQKKLLGFGSEGERVCWVRLKGPACNIFIVAVYLPHRGRTQPCQDDTLKDLQNILVKVPQGDCICVMGDLNEQLEANIPNRTGMWTAAPKSPNADKIMHLMHMHELTAANTLFAPKRTGSLNTFLQTKREGIPAHSDLGEHVGAKVKIKYNGKWVDGTVKSVSNVSNDQEWLVNFTDGYTNRYRRAQLEKILVHTVKKKVGRQLDYILVSTRWKSCITSCGPRWEPAIHRDLHGERNDHALVACKWTWRIRTKKNRTCKDFNCLYTQERDKYGNPKPNEHMCKFEEVVNEKLAETRYDALNDSATEMYDKICTAIHFAIETVLPTRRRGTGVHRKVSAKTKELYEHRTALCKQGTAEQFARVQKDIRESSLADFENWVQQWSDTIGQAESVGNTRGIYQGVNALARKQSKPPTNLTADNDGNLLKCPEDVASTWYRFLKTKFSATSAEADRPEMEELPCTQGQHELTEAKFKQGLKKMNTNKAVGPDRIPTKLYNHSARCQQLLCELIQKIWRDEEVPIKFARATFVMLFKNKGSSDDPTKYRCIGLLSHSYKVLNQCLLQQLERETESFLSEWQAGFRKKRGCSDNVLTLRTIYDEMLELGKKLYVSFIDYSAAFDSVSHKFIDEALKAAGASNKSRALFRAIYKAASATTKVQGTDGTDVLSAPFPIDRGVIQGDITSPLYFILALELILRKHDNISGKGIQFGGATVDTLGYADDAALLDSSSGVATERVTAIARGSKQDADMEINVTKTEVMHVEEQGRTTPATNAELKAVCKFECPHAGCTRVFQNAHGCKCHAGKCRYKNWHEVEKILDVQGATGTPERKFLIRWAGYGPEHDQWEPRKNVHPELINEYLHANNLYDHEWPGERCPWCDNPCKNARGVKAHMRWCPFKPNEQRFTGTCAEKRVKKNKLIEAQKHKEKVLCDGTALKNVYMFKYLGSIFSADGSEEDDVKRRISLAMQRMGALRHVFDSHISLKLKLKIYKVAVCSLMTYGCEAWSLSEKTIAMLNGANARCLSRFSGKDAHAEASARTRTYDLVAAIRRRRFKWLGHILRMPDVRLVKFAVGRQFALDQPGNMFYDVPAGLTLQQITDTARNREVWKKLSDCIGRTGSTPNILWPEPTRRPTIPREAPITRAFTRTIAVSLPTVTTAPSQSSGTTDPAKAYRARDTHALLFRPATKQTALDRWKKVKRKPKKKKPVALTDKQRASIAHAHFIIHHGTRTDAVHFLKHNPRATNVPDAVRNKLQQMCINLVAGVNPAPMITVASEPKPSQAPRTPADIEKSNTTTHDARITSMRPSVMRKIPPIPTWDEAAAAVFSSSSDESLTSPPSPSSANEITTWDEAAAAVSDSDSGESLIMSTAQPAPATPLPQVTAQHTPPCRTPTTSPISPVIPLMAAAALDSSIFSSSGEDNPIITPPPSTAVVGRRQTRSMTLERRQAAAVTAPRDRDCKTHGKQAKCSRRRPRPKPSECPKQLRIAQSGIPNAGLGLYLMEDVKKGAFVARYSGEAIDKVTNESRTGHYRIKIHNNLYLDAENTHHFEGRYINDGVRAGGQANVRFAAGYGTNTCSVTGLQWIRILATRDIKQGEELYLDYGSDYWHEAAPHHAPTIAASPQAVLTQSPTLVSARITPPPFNQPPPSPTMTTLSPIRRASKTLQRSPPLTGMLLLRPPSPWSPTTTPPRISGHYNHNHNPHTHDILNDTYKPTHTLFLNDTLILHEHSYSHALILNDTLTLNDTCLENTYQQQNNNNNIKKSTNPYPNNGSFPRPPLKN